MPILHSGAVLYQLSNVVYRSSASLILSTAVHNSVHYILGVFYVVYAFLIQSVNEGWIQVTQRS